MNLMTHPDGFGQVYHPTPTPAAMAYNYYNTHQGASSIAQLVYNYDAPWQHSNDQQSQPQIEYKATDEPEYYFYEDSSEPSYSNRKGEYNGKIMYDDYSYYDDNDDDQRIRDIGKNDDIFRQDGGTIDWLGNFMSTALQIVSLVASIVRPEQSQQQSTVDRNDVANSGGGGDDIDYAMGTLMAYGGKYLREMALRAWEYGTQTPLESFGTTATASVQSSSSSSTSSAASSSLPSLSSLASSNQPYLATLSPAELETLGLKAVAAGANPERLQMGFANAQIHGDWSQLEKEIAGVLGLGAINHPEVGLAASGVNAVSQLVSNFVQQQQPTPADDKIGSVAAGSPDSTSNNGGVLSSATSVLTKLNKVINPAPIEYLPNGQPVNPDDFIKNQNIVTRFVTEFGLEQEFLQIQKTVNGVILTVNNFLEPGSGQLPTSAGGQQEYFNRLAEQNQVDRIGAAAAAESSSSSSSVGGTGLESIASWLTSIPQAVGTAAVAAVKFLTPSAGPSAQAANKIDQGPPSVASYSEIKPLVDMNQIAFGILGVAALGTVGYGYYAASAGKSNKRRRISTRSASNAAADEDMLLLKIGQALIKGLLLNNEDEASGKFDDICQKQFDSCMHLRPLHGLKSRSTESTNWEKKCRITREDCRKKEQHFR